MLIPQLFVKTLHHQIFMLQVGSQAERDTFKHAVTLQDTAWFGLFSMSVEV